MSDTIEQAARVIDALDAYAAEVMDEQRLWLARIIAHALSDAGLLAGGWRPISEAPLGIHGHVWSPAAPERIDATGIVFEYPDGRRGVSSTWLGLDFTHWHPLPSPPEEGRNG